MHTYDALYVRAISLFVHIVLFLLAEYNSVRLLKTQRVLTNFQIATF